MTSESPVKSLIFGCLSVPMPEPSIMGPSFGKAVSQEGEGGPTLPVVPLGHAYRSGPSLSEVLCCRRSS